MAIPAAAAAPASLGPKTASSAAGVEPGPTGSSPNTPSATKVKATCEGPCGSPKPSRMIHARASPRAVTSTRSAAIAPRRLGSVSTRRPDASPSRARRFATHRRRTNAPRLPAPITGGSQAGATGSVQTATARTTATSPASTRNTGASATISGSVRGAASGASRRRAIARTGAVPAPCRDPAMNPAPPAAWETRRGRGRPRTALPASRQASQRQRRVSEWTTIAAASAAGGQLRKAPISSGARTAATVATPAVTRTAPAVPIRSRRRLRASGSALMAAPSTAGRLASAPPAGSPP
jgi:hypothetical protein